MSGWFDASYSGPIARIGGVAEITDRPLSRTSRSQKPKLGPLGFYEADAVILRSIPENLPAPFRVELSSSVRREIRDEIRRVQREAGRDVEVGGHLFSTQRPHPSSRALTVCHASWSGDGSRSGRDAIRMGNPHSVQEQLPAHFARIGNWHTHPIPGTARPSRADMENWAENADALGLSHFVGVVVAPYGPGAWDFPDISAWVVKREGVPSRPICSRAAIV